jgi:hypothetical protein
MRFYPREGAMWAVSADTCDSFAIKPGREGNPERASALIFVMIVS